MIKRIEKPWPEWFNREEHQLITVGDFHKIADPETFNLMARAKKYLEEKD